MKAFKKHFASMALILARVSSVLLLITCILVCIHVIMRGFFNSGFLGIYEIVQITMLLIGSLTLAENELSGGSIIVNVLLDMMKPRIANILGIAMYILTAAGLTYLLYNQILMVGNKYSNGAVTGILLVPHWILVLFLCIGLLFFIIAFIIKIHNMIENHKNLSDTKMSIDEIAAETVAKSEF
ncbi:MAG: TRAP transporter small permease [Oscillospiraceae bacterium]|nr:TRAP transporter small permease [Oscillospiraceae bacterium]